MGTILLTVGANPDMVTNVISQVGFPIAVCLALMYYVKYREDQMLKMMETMNTQHQTEMLALKDELSNLAIGFNEAISNNTIALNKLANIIGAESEDER